MKKIPLLLLLISVYAFGQTDENFITQNISSEVGQIKKRHQFILRNGSLSIIP